MSPFDTASFFCHLYHRIDPADIARALGGERSGRDTILCPGPGHSPRDRSLSVRLDPRAPDGFLIYSHAGDDWRECRDYVRGDSRSAPLRVRVVSSSSLRQSRSASIENPIMVAIKREHARDSAIVASLALQHGTEIETIRKALCRDSLETCPAAMRATSHPARAALSTSGLRTLDLPKDVRDVIVLADGDDHGEAAARDCAWRWRAAIPPKSTSASDGEFETPPDDGMPPYDDEILSDGSEG
jgi:hypothetical protein